MATKFKLKITTPHGEFTRVATRPYMFAVVRTSPRAMEAYEGRGTRIRSACGVTQRWIKDRGFAVTWHSTEQAARGAAARPYMWDAKLCGAGTIYPVEAA